MMSNEKYDYQEQQKQDFIKSLPMPKEFFFELFRFLDGVSENEECMHNFLITERFLAHKNIPQEKYEEIFEFFRENGGCCDCEIIYNILEKFEEYFDFEI